MAEREAKQSKLNTVICIVAIGFFAATLALSIVQGKRAGFEQLAPYAGASAFHAAVAIIWSRRVVSYVAAAAGVTALAILFTS